nr:integrase, catalytic region, zinc finger, CCHC-type, peptidase aspartic, catalytic [Tanacetum cinerariifolium]
MKPLLESSYSFSDNSFISDSANRYGAQATGAAPGIRLSRFVFGSSIQDVQSIYNHALLTNFVEKFLGTVRFGNNDFAVIVGYRDVVIGSLTIKKVYYVEDFGHNLFSVGQF